MTKTDKEAIERFRKDLYIMRTYVGWSAEQLAARLDVTRMTIANIEHNEYRMSTVQYLAIRYLLQQEIEANNNETLRKVFDVLLSDDICEEQKQKIRDALNLARKKTRKKCCKAIGKLALQKIAEMW